MFRLITHLQGVSDGIQDADGLLISTAFLIGIALASHRDVIRLRDCNQDRLARREIELLVFFLEVKCHLSAS